MAEKPAKRQGEWITEVKEHREPNGHTWTSKVQVYVVKFDNETMLYSKYETAWNNFSNLWDKCEELAQMIQKCHELEQTGAAIYGMVDGMNTSIQYSLNNLTSAQSNIKGGLEVHIDQAKAELQNLISSMSESQKNCPLIESKLDDVNEALKNMGENLTTYHNDVIYPKYKSACDEVHESYTKFI